MATITDVENAFADLLAASTGLPIEQGRIGEGPAPARPTAVWSLENIETTGSMRTEIGTDQRIVASDTRLTFAVDVVGDNAASDLMRFLLSFRASQRWVDIYRYCGLVGFNQPVNLSSIETGRYRQRYGTTVVMSTGVDLVVPSELVDKVSITVKEDTLAYQETFTVTRGEHPHDR